jgi:hypothetical protein
MKEQSRQLVENMRRGEMGGWSLGARSAIATNDGPAVAGAVAVAAIHESPHQGGARNDGPPSLVQAGPGQAGQAARAPLDKMREQSRQAVETMRRGQMGSGVDACVQLWQ